MKMNRLLLALGLLSAGAALGQSTNTGPGSTSTGSSSYNNNYNTSNANSQNATMGTNSSTNRPESSTATTNRRANRQENRRMRNNTTTPRSTSMSSGTNGSAMNSGMPSEPYATTGTSGYTNGTSSYSSGSGMSGTSSTTNINGTDNAGTSMMTPATNSGSGTGNSYNANSAGTGTSMTTPTTTDYNAVGSTNTSTTTYSTQTRRDPDPAGRNGYNNFVFGIYAGVNTTRFRGEDIDTENPAGRLGYQAGFFVRGGGRLFGQLGAEYFASSSNYFRAGDGQSAAAIRDQINIRYIQVPVYVGYKLTESERGNTSIRVQVGAEYANRISSSSGQFNLSNSEIKAGSFNALGQLGFDLGVFLIDLTYHHGLSDAVQINTFEGSTRRIVSASVGFKF